MPFSLGRIPNTLRPRQKWPGHLCLFPAHTPRLPSVDHYALLNSPPSRRLRLGLGLLTLGAPIPGPSGLVRFKSAVCDIIHILDTFLHSASSVSQSLRPPALPNSSAQWRYRKASGVGRPPGAPHITSPAIYISFSAPLSFSSPKLVGPYIPNPAVGHDLGFL